MVVVSVVAAVVAVVVEEAEADSSRVQAPLHPNIREPNIQIFRKVIGKGAPCTSDTGKTRTSVLSQPHVPGKMCSFQNLKNEPVTSPRSRSTTT